MNTNPLSLGEQPHDPDGCHNNGRPHLGPCVDTAAQNTAARGVHAVPEPPNTPADVPAD
jgi:hypothetical protein